MAEKATHLSPEKGSVRPRIEWNPASFITVGWILPLLRLGAKKPLEEEDLPLLATKETAAHSVHWLHKFTAEAAEYSRAIAKNPDEKNTRKAPHLLNALMPHVLGVFVFNGVCQAILVTLNLTMSLMVGVVTHYLNGSYNGPSAFNNGYALAFLLFGMQLLSIFSSTISRSLTNITNVRMGAALTSAIYKKSLNLASKSRQKYPAGTINTLCITDVTNVKGFIEAFNQTWSMPIQVIVAIYLVSTLLKASTAVAAGVFIGIGSLAFLIMPKLGAAMGGYMKAQDSRTTAFREFLYGVKVVKYHALEEHVESRINTARSEQIKSIKNFVKNIVLLLFVLIAQQQLTTPLTIVTYGALGNDMDAATVFVAFSLLSGLTGISGSLSGIISGLAQAFASYKRIYEFLIAEEADQSETPTFLPHQESDKSSIVLDKASFTWESSKNAEAPKPTAKPKKGKKNKKDKKEEVEMAAIVTDAVDTDIFTLEGFDLTIKKGSLVAVVGATGSGKSSLLSAVTGGMRKTGGQATVYGSVGYCPQEPWIISGSVEDNITLLDETVKGACNHAVQACALSRDLASLSNGLGTQIGEKGINLSGGQKARIALARAIARNPDIFVLDDPLSALDAHVGKEIFEGTILGSPMKGKTVIIATHLLHILPKVDNVIVMEQGKIVQNGSFKELMADMNGRLFETMKDYHLDEETEQKQVVKKDEKAAENKKEEAVAEDRQVGTVSFATYKSYFAACGIATSVWILLISIVCVLLGIGTELLLSAWTSNFLNFTNQMYYVYIYSGLSVLTPIMWAVTCILTLNMAVNGGKHFHDAALTSILAAPMSFFDTQPIGRLLNRMTADVGHIDRDIGMILTNLSVNFGGAIGTMVLLWIVSWQFIPISIPLIAVSVFLFQFYRKSYRELKRLNSIMQSPLAAHISETMSGLPTVLSYCAQDIFIQRQLFKLDQSNLAAMLFSHAQLWFMLRLEVIGALLTLALSILGVTNIVDKRFISLALTATMSWIHSLNATLYLFGNLEASMVSVERLNYYANDLPQEAARVLPKDGKLVNWPTAGAVEIKNLEIAYEARPDHVVINGISLKIQAGEKIGIVGRTGSGKSTLMDAFFRLMEANKGAIEIDGENIATLGLKKLRSSIQMIPQNPILFDGTVRSNVDVVGKYSDDDIWY
ncbi:hypothetical protein HDU99_010237, partial [Rhizoclosmatium hyalinum]